jgi:hypothetical protein
MGSIPVPAALGLAGLFALTTAPGASADDRPLVVGLIPCAETAVSEALAAGATLAFSEARSAAGPAIVLEVASEAGHWVTAAPGAVDLAFRHGAVAFLAPPDRETAHLVAQLGSRSQIPVITTSRVPSIGRTGSFWVVPVVAPRAAAEAGGELLPPPLADVLTQVDAFVRSFSDHYGREPDGWAATGYLAGSVLVAALERGATSGKPLLAALREEAQLRSGKICIEPFPDGSECSSNGGV